MDSIHLVDERAIFINERLVGPEKSQQVWNHSPEGFNWGYGGNGPAQLALAILLEFTTEDVATRLHQSFKWQHVLGWQVGTYQVDVRGWIEEQCICRRVGHFMHNCGVHGEPGGEAYVP